MSSPGGDPIEVDRRPDKWHLPSRRPGKLGAYWCSLPKDEKLNLYDRLIKIKDLN